MDWRVRLGGDEWSLRWLSEDLPKEPRVWKDDDGHYYLSSPALTACANDDEAWREAELAVARINDAATALDRGHRPVEVRALVRVGDDGSRSASVRLVTGTGHAVTAGARARAIGRVVHADGTVDPPGPSRLARLYVALEKGSGQSDLARALKAWRSGARSWGLLYHVYEIIKHDVSAGSNDYRALRRIVPQGMTWPQLEGELARFRGTANDPAHTGPEARHGRPEPKPISDPMSLREAEDLIRRLLEVWVATKV